MSNPTLSKVYNSFIDEWSTQAYMITQVSKKSLKLSPVKTLLLPLPHQPVCVRVGGGGRGQVRTEKKARNTTEPQWKQKPARVVSFGGMYTVFY